MAIHVGGHHKEVMDALLNRLEKWESVFGHLGEPDEVGNEWHALSERLEAAESECLEQARLNGMGGEREAALLAKLEATEIERDSAKKLADSLALALNTSNHERDNLRVKVAEMERQEPVGKFVQHPSNGLWEQDGYGDNPDARPLYALPGVKGE